MGWTDRLKLKAQPVPGNGTTFLEPGSPDPQRSVDAYFKEGFAGNPVVFACVNIIAEAVPTVKLEVHQLEGDNKKVITAHKLLELLRKPNPTQSWSAFAQELVTYHRLAGEAFVLKVTDARGKPRELYNLDPRHVNVVMPKDGSAVPEAYEYGSGETKKRYPVDPVTGASDVCHIKTSNPLNPVRGLSPLSAGARSADMHNAGSKWNNSLLANSARPSGILEVGTAPDAGTLDKLRVYFKKAWQGATNAGNVPMLTGGVKFSPISHTPKDMDFLSSMQDSAKNIALVFGVPLPLVTMEASTFNNLEGAKERLWTDTVLPLLDVLISALSDFLMPAFAKEKETVWLAYNADSVPALEPRRERLYKRMTAAVAGGLVTPDEARVEMGFDEKGGAATGLFMTGSMKPMEKLGETPAPSEPPTNDEAASGLAKAMRDAGFTASEVKKALAEELNDNDGRHGVAA